MDNYNINRFVLKQKLYFPIALKEIQNGKKRTHWMWFIFPQLKYLGNSEYSLYYGIENLDEAREYMENELLKTNLITICKALIDLDKSDPYLIFGFPDNLKLCSCITLFEVAANDVYEFKLVLEKFYNGKRDEKTLKFLNK